MENILLAIVFVFIFGAITIGLFLHIIHLMLHDNLKSLPGMRHSQPPLENQIALEGGAVMTASFIAAIAFNMASSYISL